MTDDTPAPGPLAIEARGIRKAFPGVVANDGVDLAVRCGEVHALLGENGAGKSTLAAVLCGMYRPDEGEIRIGGERVELRSPRDGLSHGVGMVHQHFRLVDRFSVAESIVLGDDRLPAVLSAKRMEEEVAELGDRYGLPIDPRATVGSLSVGEQQRVEIVKVLYRGAQVLLLDEPTAVLTPQEAERLFETLRSMAAEGKAVVLISHKLNEIKAVSDRVTVLRDGRVTGQCETAGATTRDLARMMVGREVEPTTRRRAGEPADTDVLVLEGVSVPPTGGRVALHDVDLRVRAGEIVGVAGVAGNGQRELAEVVAGLLKPSAGRVRVAGTDVAGRGPRRARAAGLSYVPEDRLGTGLSPSLSIADNLLLTRPRSFFVNRRSAEADARRIIELYDVKATGPHAPTRSMSGGNIQKVLLGRELDATGGSPPKVVVVASPTRGLDVGATEMVRTVLDEHRRAGVAVLLLSEDLDEVRSLSDRIVVLYEGRIAAEVDGEGADVEELGLAMAGVRPA